MFVGSLRPFLSTKGFRGLIETILPNKRLDKSLFFSSIGVQFVTVNSTIKEFDQQMIVNSCNQAITNRHTIAKRCQHPFGDNSPTGLVFLHFYFKHKHLIINGGQLEIFFDVDP